MPVGLQISDGVGNTILEVTDNTAKYLGTFSVGASNGTTGQSGTVTDSGLSSGTPWWLTTLPASMSLLVDDSLSVSFSGNTLTWVTEPNCPAFIMYYGVI